MTSRRTPEHPQLPFDVPESSLEGLTPLEARIVRIVFNKKGEDISQSFKLPEITGDIDAVPVDPIADDSEAAIRFGEENGLEVVSILSDPDANPSNENRNLYAPYIRVTTVNARRQR